jgi:hypothetical protein
MTRWGTENLVGVYSRAWVKNVVDPNITMEIFVDGM